MHPFHIQNKVQIFIHLGNALPTLSFTVTVAIPPLAWYSPKHLCTCNIYSFLSHLACV